MNRLLQSNHAVRVLSLAVAFVLWLFIVNEQDPEMTHTFMVEPQLEEVPQGLVPLEDPENLTVRLEGRRSEIYEVTPEDLHFFVDLSEGQPGENRIQVRHQDLPAGVRVRDVTPNELLVVLDELAEVEMPVQLEVKGRPAAGYALGESAIEPETVLVAGPSTRVGEVFQVVATVDARGVTEDINVPQDARALDREGNPVDQRVEVTPKVVRVRIPVEEMPTQEVPVEARLFGAPSQGYRISRVEVDPENILLYAPADLLEEVEEVFTYAVDIRGAEDNVVRDVRLRLPEGAQSRVERARVTVYIIPVEAQRSISGVPLEVLNLGQGLSAEPETDTVTVRVAGSQAAVDRLSAQNLQAQVDASGRGTGEHELPVRVRVPTNLDVDQVNPDTVTVTITGGG